MSVIAVRLGWCPRTRGQVEEIKQSEWNGKSLPLADDFSHRNFRSVVPMTLVQKVCKQCAENTTR